MADAWLLQVGDTNLNKAPFNSSLVACEDDSVSLDHRDPSHPVYGVMKQMFEFRNRYPVLTDGWVVNELSKQTFSYTLPGSFGVPTETGLWSVHRGRVSHIQYFSGQGVFGNQSVWLVYSNYNGSRIYGADCSSDEAIIAPWSANITVRNLFYPFDEWQLGTSAVQLGIDGSNEPNGCMPRINMTHYGFEAFVPVDAWLAPSPVITRFLPGHDARILSRTETDKASSVDIEVRFSAQMDCDSFRQGITVDSYTEHAEDVQFDESSIGCLTIDPLYEAYYYGPSPSIWRAKLTLNNVYDGVHVVNINNITSSDKNTSTGSHDHFMFRIGQKDNPMVFPFLANYSTSLLYQSSNAKRDVSRADSGYYISHKTAGADKWRHSLSFGAVWSDWYDYTPGNATLPAQTWSGTGRKQTWEGAHVQVQYWSEATGSSDHSIEGDLATAHSAVFLISSSTARSISMGTTPASPTRWSSLIMERGHLISWTSGLRNFRSTSGAWQRAASLMSAWLLETSTTTPYWTVFRQCLCRCW